MKKFKLFIFFNGKTITKDIPNRFFKSFNSLKINIKDTKISIKNSNSKALIKNDYLPITIHNGNHNVFNILYNKFKKLMIKNLK